MAHVSPPNGWTNADKKEGLIARTGKRFQACSSDADTAPMAQNVLDLACILRQPNHCGVAATTDIRLREGEGYLAILINVFPPQSCGSGT